MEEVTTAGLEGPTTSPAASGGKGCNTDTMSATSTFSLQRVGLLSEELWGSDNAADDDGNFTWRARDPFTEILGSESNTIASPGPAPPAEPMNTADAALAVSLSGSLSHVADTTQQLLRKVDTATHGLDAEVVRQAFHAAACAIVERCEEESRPSTSQKTYHPPLKMAVDAVRMARIQNCDEARGKTVPAFLKKNNSIPWFHLPSVSAKGGKPSGESKQEEKKPKKRAKEATDGASAKKKAKVADKQKKVASKVTASKTVDAKKKKAPAKTPVKKNEPLSRLIFVKAIAGIVGDGTVSEDTAALSEDALETADRLKHRVLEAANNSSRRFDQRREFQMDCHLGQKNTELLRSTSATPPLLSLTPLQNPFLCETVHNSVDAIVHPTNVGGACKVDDEWTKSCLPRLLATLKRGRHAILHDTKWTDRAFRVADLLHNLISLPTSSLSLRGHCNFGPHLIVTSRGSDFDSFSDAFKSSDIGLRLFKYRGSGKERAQLRKRLAQGIPGLPSSPFHVVLVAYSDLIADRVHFRKMSFQAAILDDGMSLLGCANADPDSNIHKIWERMWSKYTPIVIVCHNRAALLQYKNNDY